MHPDIPSSAETQYLEMAGGAVAYTDEGSGPVLICIHGIPGSKRDFRWLAPALVPHLRVIRIDLPGFGNTPRALHPGPHANSMAEFIWQFLEGMHLTKVTILGHSLGGVIAARAATDNRVNALVLLSSAGPFSHRGHYPKTYHLIDPLTRYWATRWFIIILGRQALKIAGFHSAFSDENIITGIQCAASIVFTKHAETIKTINKPTMVAWARDDKMVEPCVSDALVNIAPNGPRLEFNEGGHNIQKTKAIEIGETLCPWMKRGAS